MIGLIAGEIIASPYSYNNIKSPADIFFPLFESTRKGYFVNKKSSARVDNIDNIDRREQKGYSYRETRFDPSAGLYCESACAVARDLLGHSHPYDESTTVDPLIAAAVCGMFIPNKGDAISYANHIAISSSGNGRLGFPDVHAMASLTWMTYHGHTKEEIIKEAKAFNLDIYDTTTLHDIVKGNISENDTLIGKYTFSDIGYPTCGRAIVAAALSCVIRSDSWEESVRRAVAIGGHSSLIAALSGAIAEALHKDIPEHIVFRSKTYLDEDSKQILENFEKELIKPQEQLNATHEVDTRFIKFSVITREGDDPMYVIPDGHPEIEKSVEKMREAQGLTFTCVSPGMANNKLAMYERQEFRPSGAYIEPPRIDQRQLYYDSKTKRIYSISTVPMPELPSIEKRAIAALQFRNLAEYAEHIRSELEAKVGHDSRLGHIHFPTAFYPVVGKEMVELMQGDILRARMRLGDDGMLTIDTNVHTGSQIGEYLAGALNSAELAHRSMGVPEFKSLLDQYCLDYGFVPDESERQVLIDGGMDADALKTAYISNVDRAISDLAYTNDERLDYHQMFTEEELAKVEKEASHAQLEKAQREGRLHNGSAEDIIWAKCHPGAIFTIGHSNMSSDEMMSLLRKYGIEVVVDIRSYPLSTYNPQFNGKSTSSTFAKTCYAHGIEYEWFGDVFGGHMYSDIAKRHLMSYEEVMATDRAKENLKVLRDAAKAGTRIAIMCSESSPSFCHRYAMMGYALEHPSDGRIKPTEVQHILRSGQLVSQRILENHMMKSMGLSGGKGTLKEAFEIKCKSLQSKTKNDNRIHITKSYKKH